MFRLYTLYNTQSGWWNDSNPGSMTLEAFVGLMILYEMGSAAAYPEAEALFVEAAARQIWMDITPWKEEHPGTDGRRAYFCKESPCTNGVFNYLATRNESAKKRASYTTIPPFNYPVGAVKEKRPMTGEEARAFMKRAYHIGYQIINPRPEWKVLDENAPYQWGNEGDRNVDWWKPQYMDTFNSLPDREVFADPKSLVWYKFGYWDADQKSLSAFAIVSLEQLARLGK
jgi:hypothetical protein